MNAFFGQPWDAPVCETSPQAPTPVGAPCFSCRVPVVEGDQGYLIPNGTADGRVTLEAWHRACFWKSIMGPLAASLPLPDGWEG